MPTENDIFVNTLVNYARNNSKEALKACVVNRLINQFNSAGHNAASLLALNGEYEACEVLHLAGGNPERFIYGAACANNKNNIRFFINKYNITTLDPIIFGAIHGGHLELAQQYIQLQDKTKLNYAAYVIKALIHGHEKLATYFINQIAEENRNFGILAQAAAKGGLQRLSESFANKLLSPSELFNSIAKHAALGGHQNVAEYFLNKLEQQKRDYTMAAVGAAMNGLEDIVDYFINKIPEQNRNYARIASVAFENGNLYLSNLYLLKATKHPKMYGFTSSRLILDSPGARPPPYHFTAFEKKDANHSQPPAIRNLAQKPLINRLPHPAPLLPKVTSDLATVTSSLLPDKNEKDPLSKKRSRDEDSHPEEKHESKNDSSGNSSSEQNSDHSRQKKRQRRDPLATDTVEGKRNAGVFVQNFERASKAKAKQAIQSVANANYKTTDKSAHSQGAILADLQNSQSKEKSDLYASSEIVVADIVDEMDIEQNVQEAQKQRDNLLR